MNNKKLILILINCIFIFWISLCNFSCSANVGTEYLSSNKNIIENEALEEQQTSSNASNAELQVLRLDREGLIPKFESGIKEYYLTIPSSVNNIEILAIGKNQKSEIDITGNKDLKDKLNTIKITVTSEDKTNINIYTIQVTKTDDFEAANTKLEILAVEDVLLNPPFDTNMTNYNIEVANGISNLNILAIPQNEKAKVQIMGNKELKEGDNLITIIVTAPNGFSKKTYEINAHRRKMKEEIKSQEGEQENKEKLEQIYETERVSSKKINQNSEQIDEVEEKRQNRIKSNIIWTIVVGVIIIIVIIIIKMKNNAK